MMSATVESVIKDYLEGLITEREMELSFPETIKIFSLCPSEGLNLHAPVKPLLVLA
jgi:hypothetical protein